MEHLIINSGLDDISRKIFLTLNLNNLLNCRLVSRSFNRFLENPMFWLKKWIKRGLSEKNQKDWTTAINKTKEKELIKIVLLYFKKILKRPNFIDVPCFIDERRRSMRALDPRNQKSLEKFYHQAFEYNDMGSLQILAPLMKKVNAPFPSESTAETSWFLKACAGRTPIQVATRMKWPNILRVIAPLSDNINDPYPESNGLTPIHHAVVKGQSNIVKILASLVANPNIANNDGITPIYSATQLGCTEIVKVLAPLTANPNTPCNGITPIFMAADGGYVEIIKILVPLVVNPNARCDGFSPLEQAVIKGHLNIVKILAPYADDLNAPHIGPGGMTAIGLAAMKGHSEVIRCLAQIADPTAPCKRGFSPIFHAIFSRQPEVVKLLATLSKNPPNPLTNDGLTLIRLAEQLGFLEIVAILKTIQKANRF